MSGLYLLADALISGLEAKLERDAILAKVRDMEAKGASLEQITTSLRQMRDDAIKQAEEALK